MRIDNVTNNLFKAISFAEQKHRGQLRKYTGEPYVVHCIAVAKILLEIGEVEPCISAAILHDTLEDTNTTFEELENNFGSVIAGLVLELTDPPLSAGNRAKRKAISRERLATASHFSKTVKCADIIDNMKSICQHDKNFAKVFMAEIGELIPALEDSNKTLHKRLIEEYKKHKETL